MYEESKYTPGNITSLGEDEVFVFGSNLASNHAGGAARIAREKFGAIMGQGVGLQGQSSAIPTMQGGVETIRPYVDEFIKFAEVNYTKRFLVTKIGCGIAGFSVDEIAPLFADAMHLINVKLPIEFYRALENKDYFQSYLPNWLKHYTTYDMTLDLLLTANRMYTYTKSDKETVIAKLRQLVGFHGRTYSNPFIEEMYKAYPGDSTVPTKENLHEYIQTIADKVKTENPLDMPYFRHNIRLCYEVAKEMLDVADFSRPDRVSGWASPGDFYYTFYSLMTGRWNCGDSSYLDDNLRQAFPVIKKALQDNWESLVDEQGYLSNAKIRTLFANPDFWIEWQRLSEHRMALFRTIETLLHYECWDKNGNYYDSEDGFYYPRTDYSLPVFDPQRGRLHFPNFELKKTFIRSLKRAKPLF